MVRRLAILFVPAVLWCRHLACKAALARRSALLLVLLLAVSPALSAELYGLEILARDIEDEHHNTTRFLVMTADPNPPAPAFTDPCVTSFVFRVRNLPAALYKALGGFATNGVNMTKLESYMENGAFTATFFYAEVDGRPEDRGMALAFEELQFFSERFEILGVYPADPFRTRV